MKSFDETKSILGEIENYQSSTNQFFGQQAFLTANQSFVESNYKETVRLYVHHTSKEGQFVTWDLGGRILYIMSSIELQEYDQAESAIYALKSLLARHKGALGIRERDNLIVKAFMQLIKYDYDFDAMLEANGELLAQMKRKEIGYLWEIKTHEMIVFHHWLEDKAAGKAYTFRIPQELRDWTEARNKEWDEKFADGSIWKELGIDMSEELLEDLLSTA